MNPIRQQLLSMLTVEPRDGGFRATLRLSADFSLLPDHFPGSPILPGLCMVQATLLAAAVRQEVIDLRLITLKNAKLMSPVQPGDAVEIDGSVIPAQDGTFAIKAKLSTDGKRTAEFSLIAGLVVVESGAVV